GFFICSRRRHQVCYLDWSSDVSSSDLSGDLAKRKVVAAMRSPSALCVARSYIAAMTLRFARSPEAPNKMTVQGSATPPYTEPERSVSPTIVSPFNDLRPVQPAHATFQT